MRVRMSPKTQRLLVDAYKKERELTWKELAKKFGVGESTMRYFFRNGLKTLPEGIFKEITLGKKVHYVKIYGNFKPKRPHTRDSKKSIRTIKRRFGKNFFSVIGSAGAHGQKEKYQWTKERRYEHSFCGSRGGMKRVSNERFLTAQERRLAVHNRRCSLDFKSNYFVDDVNFDFVYFRNGKMIAVEEVTQNAMRGLAFVIEKRKFLDKKFSKRFPFVLTYEKSRPDVDNLLLSSGIIPLRERENRRHLIKNAVYGGMENVRPSVAEHIRFQSKRGGINFGALSEVSKMSDPYEILANKALSKFKPHGKKIFKAPYGSCFIPDNYFEFGKERIAVLVSKCNSRGSLFYAFYNHSSQAEVYKRLFGLKTLSIIFNKSGSSAHFTENIPRKLWEKSCDYKIMITDDPSIKLLSVKIEQSLCNGRVA